jgi:hypothetical protein
VSGSELDQFFVVVVVVRVERDLLQFKPAHLCSGKKGHTWFTAGVTVATFIISWRCWTVKLLTPMLLPK